MKDLPKEDKERIEAESRVIGRIQTKSTSNLLVLLLAFRGVRARTNGELG